MKPAIFSICISIVLSVLVSFCIVDKPSNNKFNIGWYVLSKDSLTGVSVYSDYYQKDFLVRPKPLLDCHHFKKLTVKDTTVNSQKIDFLEIKYDKLGANIWSKTTARMAETDEPLVFIYEDDIILEVSSDYEQKTGMYRFYHELISKEDLKEMKKEIINDCR